LEIDPYYKDLGASLYAANATAYVKERLHSEVPFSFLLRVEPATRVYYSPAFWGDKARPRGVVVRGRREKRRRLIPDSFCMRQVSRLGLNAHVTDGNQQRVFYGRGGDRQERG